MMGSVRITETAPWTRHPNNMAEETHKSLSPTPPKPTTVHREPSPAQLLVDASYDDPFGYLGVHTKPDGQVVIRGYRPDAVEMAVLLTDDKQGQPLRVTGRQVHEGGVFEAEIAGDKPSAQDYQLEYAFADGSTWTTHDAYSLPSVLGELDMLFFGEGNHVELYRRMGAHPMTLEGVTGTVFSVWAPNARRVSIVGDFNQWDGRANPMRRHPSTGIWDIFLPGVEQGMHYKFEIKDYHNNYFLKSDPLAFYSQNGRQTASIVWDIGKYSWNDAEWMRNRRERDHQKEPLSVYEVHLGSWMRIPEENHRFLSYRELAERLVPYVKEMGYTHIELMPVAEFPFDGSWGYQVVSFYAPTSRFGNPDDFRYFVDVCHQNGIGVLLDWVPAHFPRDSHGLARFDGTCLYEHEDPREGEHRDWGTLIFNYGRNEVRNFLIANGLFWLDEYHIDGLRVDAVASMLYRDYSREGDEWIPNYYGGRENLEAIYFMKRFNELAYEKYPGVITVAEESTDWPGVSRPTYLGGLGFGFKWNMGWMNDSLSYMSREPIHRQYHQNNITFSLIYAFHENFILVLSHDEVVHGKRSLLDKMPGDRWQKFANLRMFYAWMYGHPGKKLLFMGGEFGQSQEWNYASSLDWHLLQYPEHQGISKLVKDLNRLYREEAALYSLDDTHEGFEWIDFHDAANSIVSFVRKGADGSRIVFVVNATPVPRYDYRVGLPVPGYYKEILNSDAALYGGSDVGNHPGRTSEAINCQGRDNSALFNLPPLATIVYKWMG